jgi:hypothetical protein
LTDRSMTMPGPVGPGIALLCLLLLGCTSTSPVAQTPLSPVPVPAPAVLACPSGDEMATAVHAQLAADPPARPAGRVAITCDYRPPAGEVWSVRVQRYASAGDATRGFSTARRANLSVEQPLPAGPPLGDEAVIGRQLRGVLIVRHGTDLIQVDAPAAPTQLIAAERLVAAKVGH